MSSTVQNRESKGIAVDLSTFDFDSDAYQKSLDEYFSSLPSPSAASAPQAKYTYTALPVRAVVGEEGSEEDDSDSGCSETSEKDAVNPAKDVDQSAQASAIGLEELEDDISVGLVLTTIGASCVAVAFLAFILHLLIVGTVGSLVFILPLASIGMAVFAIGVCCEWLDEVGLDAEKENPPAPVLEKEDVEWGEFQAATPFTE